MPLMLWDVRGPPAAIVSGPGMVGEERNLARTITETADEIEIEILKFVGANGVLGGLGGATGGRNQLG